MSIQGMLERAGIIVVGNKVQIPGAQSNIGAGKIIWLDAANGGSGADALTPGTAQSSITNAIAKIVSGKNDQVRLIQGATSVNLASGLTWSNNCSHLIGEGAFGLMNQRSRIGHSANFATLLTVSGYGNSFQNLYFMHGRGSATNATGIAITGPRNSFINCHIGGPMHATEAGTAAYKLLSLENSESYFKDCVIGIDTTPLTAALTLCSFGAQADPPRVVFDNCLFLTCVNAAGGAGATFLKVAAGAGAGLALFRKCAFINIGSQAMTYGIDGAGLGNFKMAFDSDCYFAGCTDVVASTYEASVFLCPANTPINQVTGGASVALFNGLAAKPDVS